MDAICSLADTASRGAERAPDPTELSDADLEHVVGGLTRVWIPALERADGAAAFAPMAPTVLPV